MITIDKNRCPQNHRCPAIKACPVNAISQKDFELPIIDNTICIECKKCIKFCPMRAIQQV
jgi:Fe-S-cluster-containing hydrogenase component 2